MAACLPYFLGTEGYLLVNTVCHVFAHGTNPWFLVCILLSESMHFLDMMGFAQAKSTSPPLPGFWILGRSTLCSCNGKAL